MSTATRLPWREAHCLLREHGAGAAGRALQRVSALEAICDFVAALWWGRIYLAITELEDEHSPAGSSLMH